jgi:DNA polymerase, archaea type
LTGLSLQEVCHSTISTWWSKVFEEMGFAPSLNNYDYINTINNYEGGMVIEPKKGFYHNLKVVDVVSLYPSIAILFNISFDTVNCECCSNRQDAKVPTEVIDKQYWICKQKEGAFPKKLADFKAERIRQKQLGNIIKQQGLKILINGGYGLFGYEGFKYFDLRVAELITAYGRHTLSRMQEIAKLNGFTIVGGDTDLQRRNIMWESLRMEPS